MRRREQGQRDKIYNFYETQTCDRTLVIPQILAFDRNQNLSLFSSRLIPRKESNPLFRDIVLSKLESFRMFPDKVMSADSVPIEAFNFHHDMLVMFSSDPEIQRLIPFWTQTLSNDSRPLLQLERLYSDNTKWIRFSRLIHDRQSTSWICNNVNQSTHLRFSKIKHVPGTFREPSQNTTNHKPSWTIIRSVLVMSLKSIISGLAECRYCTKFST